MNEFIYPMRIHIEDTDYTGTVFHSNYLNFMERARSEWLEHLQIGSNWRAQHQIHFLIHSVNMQFLKPAQLHEQVEVVSKVKTLTRASFVLDQYLRPAASPDKILCKAEIKLVCVGLNMKPCAIPATPILETIRRDIHEL